MQLMRAFYQVRVSDALTKLKVAVYRFPTLAEAQDCAIEYRRECGYRASLRKFAIGRQRVSRQDYKS